MSEPEVEVEIIDDFNPANNMYGCSPCPKCSSRFRWPDHGNVLRCDDCGYLSRWKNKEAKYAPAPAGKATDGLR